MNSNNKIYCLEYVRAFACWLVVLFHAYAMFNRCTLGGYGGYLFLNGNFGVDIFFVLSGYVISFSINKIESNSSVGYLFFLLKRWVRISPAYFFWTAFFIITYLKGWVYIRTYYSNILYSLLYLPGDWKFPPLSVGWTLNYEMYFYFLIALFYFLNRKNVLLFILFISPFIGMITTTGIPLFDKIIFSTYMWEFLGGILLCRYIPLQLSLPKSYIIIILIILTFCIGYCYSVTFFNIEAVKIVTAVGVLYWAIVYQYAFPMQNRSVLFLGKVSYSTYLCHIPIFYYVPLVLRYQFQVPSLYLENALFDILLVLIVLAVSYVSYIFLELKVYDWFQKRGRKKKRTVE